MIRIKKLPNHAPAPRYFCHVLNSIVCCKVPIDRRTGPPPLLICAKNAAMPLLAHCSSLSSTVLCHVQLAIGVPVSNMWLVTLASHNGDVMELTPELRLVIYPCAPLVSQDLLRITRGHISLYPGVSLTPSLDFMLFDVAPHLQNVKRLLLHPEKFLIRRFPFHL